MDNKQVLYFYTSLTSSIINVLNHNGFLNLVLNDAIMDLDTKNYNEHDKRLYTCMLYGVVERKIYLDYELNPFIKGVRVKPNIKTILRLGAYGITFLNIANHYLINTLVELTKEIDFRSSKFVNAVLRNYDRNKRLSLESLDDLMKLSVTYSIPVDLIQYLKKKYPNNYEEIIDYRKKAYNCYRIINFDCKDEIIKYGEENGMDVLFESNCLLSLSNWSKTLFFQNKFIIPQDLSSAQVVEFMDPTKEQIILDSCSAPGTKTIQIAEKIEDDGVIIASDISSSRVELVNTIKTLYNHPSIQTLVCDAQTYDYNKEFDIILLDAPCSGLGVMKHKPDLKYRFSISKINELQIVQRNLLNHLSQFVKSKGELIYSTCTITKEENEDNIKNFINTHSDFSLVCDKLILPSDIQDGFYMAKLKRK